MARYILLADRDLERGNACLEFLRPLGIDVQIADEAHEALGIVDRHGPPRLLIIDLEASPPESFRVIDAVLAGRQTDVAVIAWAPSRAVREFAMQHFSGAPVRVVAREAALRVGRAAIERALQSERAGLVTQVDDTIAGLLTEAKGLCGALGAAVYLKAPGETKYRSSVAWMSEAPSPDVLDSLPHIFDMMVERGEPLFWSAHGAWALSGGLTMAPNDLQTLAAVPIVCEGETIGAVCVFDITPLDLRRDTLEAFKAMGHIARPSACASQAPTADTGASSGAEAAAAQPAMLLDRRSGDFAIAREMARARRERQPLTIVLFAVDFVNADGAPAADEARDSVAAVYDTLATAVRGSDLAIRWSAAEFLLVLAGVTASEARPIAERIRAVTHTAQRHAVAVSGGIAELVAAEGAESIIARAAARVQLARARGHNRVA